MLVVMWLAAIFAGVVHVLIFCMESLWWTTPEVRARFHQSPEQADATRLFAFNQGFYNLFLAIGTFAGLALVLMDHPGSGLTLVSWNCLSMLGAAIVLWCRHRGCGAGHSFKARRRWSSCCWLWFTGRCERNQIVGRLF